jgi:hypothetical protein
MQRLYPRRKEPGQKLAKKKKRGREGKDELNI